MKNAFNNGTISFNLVLLRFNTFGFDFNVETQPTNMETILWVFMYMEQIYNKLCDTTEYTLVTLISLFMIFIILSIIIIIITIIIIISTNEITTAISKPNTYGMVYSMIKIYQSMYSSNIWIQEKKLFL